MDIKNCKRCGRIFQYVGNPLCQDCLKEDEEEFNKVRTYVADHSKPSIKETSLATGVDEKKIIKYLRDGRLMRAGCAWEVLECESCGAPIKGGRFCDRCANQLARGLSEGMDKGKKEINKGGKERMHISDF